MNVTLYQTERGSESAAMSGLPRQRVDELCCDVINRGVMVQASFNTVCAIEYLKSHNIDPQVIERVLLHPEQRRKASH